MIQLFNQKKAEIKKPLEIFIQIVLIMTFTVMMLAFVGRIGDSTAFNHDMITDESAMTATIAAAAPAPGHTKIVHKKLDLSKFEFVLGNGEVKVRASGAEKSQKYGWSQNEVNSRSIENFVVKVDDFLQLSDRGILVLKDKDVS